MRYVPLREAEPGMVLAADLYDSVGRTLIGCHCELTEAIWKNWKLTDSTVYI